MTATLAILKLTTPHVVGAAGRCCALPAAVDDFGVCGGSSSSGLLQLTLAAAVGAASQLTQGAGILPCDHLALRLHRCLLNTAWGPPLAC